MAHHLVGMAEIAEILGVSRQRVAQLVETYEDFPKPEVELSGGRVWSRTAVETWISAHPERKPGRPEAGDQDERSGKPAWHSAGLFERFTDRARSAIVKAQEEARLLRHNYIGTEHVLLGLIALGEGLAWQTLAALDVHLDAARERTRQMIGVGTVTPVGHIAFTPRAKKVLERSLGESLKLGHNYIGTEHVLLGLVAEKEGVAWKVLEAEGLRQGEVRDAVLGATRGYSPPSQRGTRSEKLKGASGPDMRCSFCGKHRDEVAGCVAGPGVYICNECVLLCVEILGEEGVDVARSERNLVLRMEELERRLDELEGKN